ncbi:hypothetical protein ABBQ38_014844 [Trebouxia sp. C0009 RCD-2024]
MRYRTDMSASMTRKMSFWVDVMRVPTPTVNKEAAEAASGVGVLAEHRPQKRVTWADDLERVRVFDVSAVAQHKFDITLGDSQHVILGVLSKVQEACDRPLLKAFGLPLGGSQEELVHRLEQALAAAAVHGHAVANDSALTTNTPAIIHQAKPHAAAPTDHAAPPSVKPEPVLPQEVAPSLSENAWASSSAVGHFSMKRKVAKYDSSSAGHGAASKRIKGVLPSSKGKAAPEISQSATQALRSAHEAPQHPQDEIETGWHSQGRLAVLQLHLARELSPAGTPRGGSGHDGKAASVHKHRLIQLEEAGSNLENTLQPHGSTVKRQTEQPEVGVQQQSPPGALDGAQEENNDLRGPHLALPVVGLLSEQENAPESVDICMQAESRNLHVDLGLLMDCVAHSGRTWHSNRSREVPCSSQSHVCTGTPQEGGIGTDSLLPEAVLAARMALHTVRQMHLLLPLPLLVNP